MPKALKVFLAVSFSWIVCDSAYAFNLEERKDQISNTSALKALKYVMFRQSIKTDLPKEKSPIDWQIWITESSLKGGTQVKNNEIKFNRDWLTQVTKYENKEMSLDCKITTKSFKDKNSKGADLSSITKDTSFYGEACTIVCSHGKSVWVLKTVLCVESKNSIDFDESQITSFNGDKSIELNVSCSSAFKGVTKELLEKYY